MEKAWGSRSPQASARERHNDSGRTGKLSLLLGGGRGVEKRTGFRRYQITGPYCKKNCPPHRLASIGGGEDRGRSGWRLVSSDRKTRKRIRYAATQEIGQGTSNKTSIRPDGCSGGTKIKTANHHAKGRPETKTHPRRNKSNSCWGEPL